MSGASRWQSPGTVQVRDDSQSQGRVLELSLSHLEVGGPITPLHGFSFHREQKSGLQRPISSLWCSLFFVPAILPLVHSLHPQRPPLCSLCLKHSSPKKPHGSLPHGPQITLPVTFSSPFLIKMTSFPIDSLALFLPMVSTPSDKLCLRVYHPPPFTTRFRDGRISVCFAHCCTSLFSPEKDTY